MTHKGSLLTFKVNAKKGIITFRQKETYEKPDGDKFTEEFSGEFDLGREQEKIEEWTSEVAKSWARGDSIREEAKDNFDDLDDD